MHALHFSIIRILPRYLKHVFSAMKTVIYALLLALVQIALPVHLLLIMIAHYQNVICRMIFIGRRKEAMSSYAKMVLDQVMKHVTMVFFIVGSGVTKIVKSKKITNAKLNLLMLLTLAFCIIYFKQQHLLTNIQLN